MSFRPPEEVLIIMKASTKKVTELIVDELKSVIHEVITEDMEFCKRRLRFFLIKNQ